MRIAASEVKFTVQLPAKRVMVARDVAISMLQWRTRSQSSVALVD
jgi:hypothetical protein